MIQNETRLLVADNSGARSILVIRCLGGSKRKFSGIGNKVVATVKKADPNANIKKGDVVFAVIVTTRNNFRRLDGSYIKFSENCAIIINEKGEPVGTRILIPLLYELEWFGYKKLLSLTRDIL